MPAQSAAERSSYGSAWIDAALPSASGSPSTSTRARWKPSAAAAATSAAPLVAVIVEGAPLRGDGRTVTSDNRSAPGTSSPIRPAAVVATSSLSPRWAKRSRRASSEPRESLPTATVAVARQRGWSARFPSRIHQRPDQRQDEDDTPAPHNRLAGSAVAVNRSHLHRRLDPE